jgi:hypothetical protein
MKMNMFYNCASAVEVQLRFDELSKIYTGQVEFLQSLKEEHSVLMHTLEVAKPVGAAEKEITLLSDIIKTLQEKVNPEGLHLEISGSWLWLSGKTYAVREVLKSLGFRYSSNKQSWYLRNEKSFNQSPFPMDQIRELYGSQKVDIK